MLIIRRLNYIDAASGIFLSVIARPVHRLGKNSLPTCAQDALTVMKIPDAASIEFSLLMMSI